MLFSTLKPELVSEHLELLVAASLVGAALLMLDDAAAPSAHLVITFLEETTKLEKIIRTNLF